MVTKLGPLCEVKLLKNNVDKAVVRSPEKAGGGGSTPSLATIILKSLFELRGTASVRSRSAAETSSERLMRMSMTLKNLSSTVFQVSPLSVRFARRMAENRI